MVLGHDAASGAEVDDVMARAEVSGARIAEPVEETSWGASSGCFQDPDGQPREAVWNTPCSA